MTPQEKSRAMVEAVKYNLANGLMTHEEVKSAQTPEQKKMLAMKALVNQRLHKRMLEQKQQEEEQRMWEEHQNSKVIYRRKKE